MHLLEAFWPSIRRRGSGDLAIAHEVIGPVLNGIPARDTIGEILRNGTSAFQIMATVSNPDHAAEWSGYCRI